MQKIVKLLICLMLCAVMGIACAAADGGVTILAAPKRVDLYVAYENVYRSGSIRFRLDRGTVVEKYAITQYHPDLGFNMTIHDEGDGIYRMDLQGYYTRMMTEAYDLPDALPFTFTIQTNKGEESVTFPVHFHEEIWDPAQIEMGFFEGDFEEDIVSIGQEIVLPKPTLNGEVVKTGLINNEIQDTDPYFGSGWVNDLEYTADTVQLVRETADAFIMKVINPGTVWAACMVREINTNRSLYVTNGEAAAYASDIVFYNEWWREEARFTKQEGAYESGQLTVRLDNVNTDSDTLDETKLECQAYIRDTSIVADAQIVELRPSRSRHAVVLRYAVSGAKKPGVTQLVIDLTYDGQKHTMEIPVVVCASSVDNYPEHPKVSFDFPATWSYGDVPLFRISGEDADKYEWEIDCPALYDGMVRGNPGRYPVQAKLYSETLGSTTIDLHHVTVKGDTEKHHADKLLINETWSNYALGPNYCSVLDNVLEMEMGAYAHCSSNRPTHNPTYAYELVGVSPDCPYEIKIDKSRSVMTPGTLEEGNLDPYFWVIMTPKTMPLKTGRYPYQIRITVTCCSQTTSAVIRVPMLVVDIPENKLDYLHTPPAYMCLDRDSLYWDREILTPINRYCDLQLIFASGAETWEEGYKGRYQVYKPSELGPATWEYVASYANGELVLHSGETMIFSREEFAKLDQNTHLTAINGNYDLTPEQRYVPRLFPPSDKWNKEWFLKAQLVDTDDENAICYELTLVNEHEKEEELPQSTTLYLPYPEGMTAEEAQENEFVVVHGAKSGTEIYSTQSGTLSRGEYGLEMTVNSLSPFTINWGTEEEMNELISSVVDTGALPKTGDASQLWLWFALLVIAGGAMLILKRKTK